MPWAATTLATVAIFALATCSTSLPRSPSYTVKNTHTLDHTQHHGANTHTHWVAPLQPLPGVDAVRPALYDAAQWIMTLNVSSGALNNSTGSFNHTYPGGAWAVVGGRHSIFQVCCDRVRLCACVCVCVCVQVHSSWLCCAQVGNLARVLLASAQVFGNTEFLEEGLKWCDHFVSTQHTITSSTGDPAGYWGIGYGCEGFEWYHRGLNGEATCNGGARDLFDGDGWVLVADTGTAVTALALGAQLVPSGSSRHEAYVNALKRYSEFILHGCKTPPSGCLRCPPRGTGFVLPGGALGDGFFGLDPGGSGKVKPDLEPYSIATFLSGVAFFTEFDFVNSGQGNGGGGNHTSTVMAALRWILGTVAKDGHIPDILDGSIEAGTNGSAIPYVENRAL